MTRVAETLGRYPAFFTLDKGWEATAFERDMHGFRAVIRLHPKGWYMAHLRAEWRRDTGEILNECTSYVAPEDQLVRVLAHVYPARDSDLDAVGEALEGLAIARQHWIVVLSWVRAMTTYGAVALRGAHG